MSLEPLRHVRWSGLVPAIVAVVINDPTARFEWHLEPTIRYDEIQDSYYLTMAPNAAIHVAVTLGYEGQLVTIPVHFTEATPLHD